MIYLSPSIFQHEIIALEFGPRIFGLLGTTCSRYAPSGTYLPLN